LLYQFELLGTSHDVDTINEIIKNFWGEENYEQQ
jgi:protein involved in ribonucleotide reduction